MTSKKELGQFFTTNSDDILKGFESYVLGKDVLDPFAGNGDLLSWAEKNGAKSNSGLDIDTNLVNEKVKLNNSLVSIPNSNFIITNPPYLATNKMTKGQRTNTHMKGYEDLYLLSIKLIIEANPNEGIVIIPVNFFSAENSDNLRKEFMSIYDIKRVTYFKEQIFVDTTYNVVAFYFLKKIEPSDYQNIEITFMPDKETKFFHLEECFDYRIAGSSLSEILSTKSSKIIRLTEKHIEKNPGQNKINALFNDKKTSKEYSVNSQFKKIIDGNIILLNCIDTNASEDAWIKAEDIRSLNYSCLVGKNTSRNIAYVLLDNISLENQEKIIAMFNDKLNALRRKYNSLFLTNFRDNDRKRISFDFCYKLIAYCLNQITK